MQPLTSEQTTLIHYGGWRPVHPRIYEAFFNDISRRARLIDNKTHEPAVLAFQTAINNNAEMVDLFGQMFLQVRPRVTGVINSISAFFFLPLSHFYMYFRSQTLTSYSMS
jgi:hypothetical protein